MNYIDLKNDSEQKWNELNYSEITWIRIGYGASGEAAGAKKIYDFFLSKTSKLKNIKVDLVGALGISYAEPLIDITHKDGIRIFYNNVNLKIANRILDEHVKNNTICLDLAMGQILDNPNSSLIEGLPDLNNEEPLRYTKKIATKNCGAINPRNIEHYIANGGYEGLFKSLDSLTPEKTLDNVKESGLRGRGGAAFSTGVKWSFLAGNKSPVKYVLANCEEGDPGAFNDKGILESDPHMLLEGLIICGYSTGASNGHIFIRDGHKIPIENSRKAVEDAYSLGLLGQNIMGTGFNFDVEVSLTGDSYVAGEETALMEAIEGKRSMPRFKPPFPAVSGLWGKPSNINNVKTLAYVPYIINKGSDEYKTIGTKTSSGTAIVCLSGHISRPGMYEIEMGMTINDVLEKIGGGSSTSKEIKLLQTGGPLGGVLGKEGFDVQIDFDAMSKSGAILGSGGIIVGDESTDVVDLIRNLVAFNQFESCGKCFPCRLGNTHMLDILNRICNSMPNDNDLEIISKIGNSMKTGSLCGHGQLGYNPISSAIKYFDSEFKNALKANHPVSSDNINEMILPTRTRP